MSSCANLYKQNQKQNSFKNKGYKLELLSPETMKLLVSTKKDVAQYKDGEDVPKVESAEVNLVHCKHLRCYLFTFVPNKQFGQLITIAPHSLTMLNTTNAEFLSIEVWHTDLATQKIDINQANK